MADAIEDSVKRPPWHRPFAEQVTFFRQKLNLPTVRTIKPPSWPVRKAPIY